MATEGVEMQGTECPVCHENYNDPKILPCAHIFCRDCLVGWMKKKTEALCPLCCSTIVDPQDSSASNTDDIVDSLPTDHTMTVLMESVKIFSEEHVCYLHRSVSAPSWCLQCNLKLCQSCVDVHKSLPVTSGHKLENLSTLTLEGLTTTRREPCSLHSDKTSELFCTFHNVLICHVCATSKHRTCPEVICQQEMYEKCKQTLSELEDKLKVSISALSEVMTKIEKHQIKSEKSTMSAFEDIDITCNTLLNCIEACRKRLKKLVQEADDKIKAKVVEQKSSLCNKRGRLTAHLNLIQRVQQIAPCSSLVTMVPQLKDRITNLGLATALPKERQDFKMITLTIDRRALFLVERELEKIGDIVVTSFAQAISRETARKQENQEYDLMSQRICKLIIPAGVMNVKDECFEFPVPCDDSAKLYAKHLFESKKQSEVLQILTKSSIKVFVYKADITQLPLDAIVNTANENLCHGGGVAAAIARAAGVSLELEGDEYVMKNGPVPVTGVVMTCAGNLPCKKVFHAVGPRWDDYTDKVKCQQDLMQTVFNCLVKAHSQHFESIAVSSISSAIFAVPKELCARMYLAAVQRFEHQLGASSTLQHIHFVDIIDEMVGIIQDTFTYLWNKNVMLLNICQGTSAIKSSEIGSSLPVTHLSLSSESKDKMDESLMSDDCKKFTTESGISIYVYKADITELLVDAIVNMTNSYLNHNSGVAAAVLKVAGQTLQMEGAIYMRERKCPLNVGEVFMTTAGNLCCKKVLHAVGPIHYDSQSESEFQDMLGQTIINSLTEAQSQHFASVAFCPMSSAIFHVPKKLCAQVFLSAVQRFEQEYGHTSILKKIHLVDINDDMVDIMKETFSNLWNKPYMPPAFQQSTCETSSCEFQSRSQSVKNSLDGTHHIRDMSYLSVPANSKMFTTQSGMTVFAYKANITEVKVDSIVSAADDRLSHSLGVSQAIAKAAGQTLYEEGKKCLPKGGRLKVTDVVKTTAGKLPYKFVLHAVGPQYYYYQKQTQFKSDLANTLLNCLKYAYREQITSLAFPSVGSAIPRVPRELCAQIYLEVISRFEKEFAGKTNIRYIHFVDIRSEMVKVIQETFDSGWDTTITKSINHPLSDSTGISLAQGLPSGAQPSATVVKSRTKFFPIFKDISDSQKSGRSMIYRYLFQFPILSLSFHQGDVNSTDIGSLVFWQNDMNSLKDEPLKEYLRGKKVNSTNFQKLKKIWLDSNSDIEVIPVFPSINVVLSVMPATTMSTDITETISRILSRIGLKNMPLTIPSLISITGGESGTATVTQTSNHEIKEFALGLYTAVEEYSSNLLRDSRDLFVTDKNGENIRMMADVICQKIAIDKSQAVAAQNEQANVSTGIKSTTATNAKKCALCCDEITDPRRFSCKHEFCISCFSAQQQHTCPICSNVQKKFGIMCMQCSFKYLAGFDTDKSFVIVYSIPSGTVMSSQNVKMSYNGKIIKAFLPDTLEGRRVLMLLKVAFDRNLIFILKQSGSHLEISWNGIEHKTETIGGPPKYSYPDHDYLSRVQQELRAKGVTEKDLTEKQKIFIETPHQILTPFNSNGDFSYLFNV